jgi:porin
MTIRTMRCAAAGLALALLASPLRAQTPAEPAPEPAEKPSKPARISALNVSPSLAPLADPGGLRSALEDKGITFWVNYIGEAMRNMRGGLKRGTIYEGRLDLQLDVNLETLAGFNGLTFHAQLFQIHGRGPSRRRIGNRMTASNIEALPGFRLAELWLEQAMFDDFMGLRVGQLAADEEFVTSENASLFINGTFGWPTIMGVNLPGGGAAYPFATPGVRVKLEPRRGINILGAVLNGDPTGGRPGEPLRHNRHGTRFPVHNSPFVIVEASYAYNWDEDAAKLPGTVKVGGWYHFGRFDDQRYGTDGLSLSDPAGTGVARRRRGNFGLYAIADQMLWRLPETADQGLAAFARVSVSPGDRNPVNFYADGGFTFKGAIPGRPEDMLGLGFAYAKVSKRARSLDRDARDFGATTPIHSSEVLLEITYQVQIVRGWTLQPDFQYVWRPFGGAAHPGDPGGRRIRNAAVIGLRTTLQY